MTTHGARKLEQCCSGVVTQKATNPFETMDGAMRWKLGKIWADNLVLEALMVSLSMKE